MNELRDRVIDAHGGLKRWGQIETIEADAAISGLLWERKGHAGALESVHIAARAHEQWISYSPFRGDAKISVCTPRRTEIRKGEIVLEARDNPRASFVGHTVESPWDDLNLAYFSGYAMWNYLTVPFIFALPGFSCQEIEPWEENGEIRRRLKVIFPPAIATHCQEQIFHINRQGLIVRMDYSAAVTGGMPTAHYLLDQTEVSGLVYPQRRRAFRRREDGAPVEGPAAVTIDFSRIMVR